MIYPVGQAYPVTQTFAEHEARRIKNGWKYYNGGIDWGCPSGTRVVAAASGTVTRADMDATGYGKHVRIDHGNGQLTIYGHLGSFAAKAGQKVAAGEVIGYSDNTGNSTGPHLHFELRINDQPVDPMKYLAGQQAEPGPGTAGPVEVKPLFKVTVQVDALNVRSGPGVGYPKVGSLLSGAELSVSGEEIWLQIGPGKFIAARYADEDYVKIEGGG